jgi:hypothetical protein
MQSLCTFYTVVGSTHDRVTTPSSRRFLGMTTITHPFHPLHGQSFEIISSKKWDAIHDILSLKTSNGIITIWREWTDRANPDVLSIPIDDVIPVFSYYCLQQLAFLMTELNEKNKQNQILGD